MESSWRVMSADDGALVAPLGERRADLARREEDVRARLHERRIRQGLAVPVAGPRIVTVLGPGLVAEDAEP
jgi:hypothetical protein